jgi:hypothetical protein
MKPRTFVGVIAGMNTTKPNPVLALDDPIFVRRLSREINRVCFPDGFYSSFNYSDGSRKFHGYTSFRGGRLIAKEVGGAEVDLTGAESVSSPRHGNVSVSRHTKALS